MCGDNSGVLTEPYSNIKLTRKHHGRDTSLLNETQSQSYGGRASTRSTSELLEDGTWEVKGLCSSLPARGGLRKTCQAPLPTVCSSDLIPQPAEPQGDPVTIIHMRIFRVWVVVLERYHSVTPHQSARSLRWAHYHHPSHTGISSPHLCPRLRHTLGICNGMAGLGSSALKDTLPQASSHKRK